MHFCHLLFGFCNDKNSIPVGGQKFKATAHYMFNKIFKMEEFIGLSGGGCADNMLGSHSIIKYLATYACKSGCSKGNTAHNVFNKIFKMEEFIGLSGGGCADNMLGSHSITKFVVTYACKLGYSKDNKEIQG